MGWGRLNGHTRSAHRAVPRPHLAASDRRACRLDSGSLGLLRLGRNRRKLRRRLAIRSAAISCCGLVVAVEHGGAAGLFPLPGLLVDPAAGSLCVGHYGRLVAGAASSEFT